MNDHSTDKILLVVITLGTLAAGILTGEQKIYDGFLIALGVTINQIGSRVRKE